MQQRPPAYLLLPAPAITEKMIKLVVGMAEAVADEKSEQRALEMQGAEQTI